MIRILRTVRRSLLTLASISLVALVAAPADASASHLEPIAVARHHALGTTVSVLGSVTVQSGAFDAGFAIQGVVDGIYVLDAGGAARNVGDVVQVTGTLVDNYGLLSIQPTSVNLVLKAPPIPAHPRTTGSVGEATEGQLLHLHGTMVGPLVDDSPYGYKLEIDDGSGPVQIFLYPGTGISTAGLVPGAEIETSCFSSQFDTHYECDPPNAASFHVD
jgi:hypothetical protein